MTKKIKMVDGTLPWTTTQRGMIQDDSSIFKFTLVFLPVILLFSGVCHKQQSKAIEDTLNHEAVSFAGPSQFCGGWNWRHMLSQLCGYDFMMDLKIFEV